ncbi:hypothetical protein D3C72_2125230 [compost metagenome]
MFLLFGQLLLQFFDHFTQLADVRRLATFAALAGFGLVAFGDAGKVDLECAFFSFRRRVLSAEIDADNTWGPAAQRVAIDRYGIDANHASIILMVYGLTLLSAIGRKT